MKGVPEKLEGLHPTLVYRVLLLLDDPALKGRYGIVSGMRSEEHQRDLYRRYLAGTFKNLVANPDRELWTGPNFPFDWKPRGSWHMTQADGYAHAVDLARPWNHTRAHARSLVHPLLPKYGLSATVTSEWWHVQALTSSGWVEGPLPPDITSSGDEMKQVNDPNRNRLFTVWVLEGTTTVREHNTYLPEAGEMLPNASYIIDEQVKTGAIRKVS